MDAIVKMGVEVRRNGDTTPQPTSPNLWKTHRRDGRVIIGPFTLKDLEVSIAHDLVIPILRDTKSTKHKKEK
jgi:hypothetical protein